MKRDTDAFAFDLSRAELYWLAGAFGIASLPLPDVAPLGLSPDQVESRQKDGHASLLTRGLLHRSPGFGWQVDRLSAALIQWIATAPSLFRLERIPKEGTPHRSHLFITGEQGLSLEMDGDTAHFVIYESLPLLQDAALHWLSLPAKTKTAASHSIPQPFTFLPIAWKNPQLAARILEERGLKDAKSTLSWISSLEWVFAIAEVKLEGRKNSILDQLFLCSDKISVWGGEGKDTIASFVPMTLTKISAKITKMLN